jgi:hypothetical protein
LPPVLRVSGGPELVVVGFVLLVGLAFTAIWIGISYWVYKDANERNMNSPALWGLLTFFAGLIGVVLYLVLRE